MEVDLTDTEEEPRDWNTEHPSLHAKDAPHETAGLLRAYRTGKPVSELLTQFGLRPAKLMKLLDKAIAEESEAAHANRHVYDDLIKGDIDGAT